MSINFRYSSPLCYLLLKAVGPVFLSHFRIFSFSHLFDEFVTLFDNLLPTFLFSIEFAVYYTWFIHTLKKHYGKSE